MQVARELQSSRQAQQASGQHDPSHLQSQIQTLRMLQAQAMQLQRERMQSLTQGRPASQAPPMPNMQMGGMQMQQQQRSNRSAPAMAQMAQMQSEIRPQMQTQAMQNKSAPPLPQTRRHSLNLNTINQLSNQSRGLYRPVPPDAFNTGQPDPPPQYTPPMRPQSQVPAYNMAPQAHSSPPKPPFPLSQSSESNVRQSSPGLGAPVVRALCAPTLINRD